MIFEKNSNTCHSDATQTITKYCSSKRVVYKMWIERSFKNQIFWRLDELELERLPNIDMKSSYKFPGDPDFKFWQKIWCLWSNATFDYNRRTWSFVYFFAPVFQAVTDYRRALEIDENFQRAKEGLATSQKRQKQVGHLSH